MCAATIAASFAFGTAFGLAVSNTPAARQDAPLNLGNQALPDSNLVCQDVAGKVLCWPKDMSPDKNEDMTCNEAGDSTLCFSTPKLRTPGLEL